MIKLECAQDVLVAAKVDSFNEDGFMTLQFGSGGVFDFAQVHESFVRPDSPGWVPVEDANLELGKVYLVSDSAGLIYSQKFLQRGLPWESGANTIVAVRDLPEPYKPPVKLPGVE